jgi:hypothetical protein
VQEGVDTFLVAFRVIGVELGRVAKVGRLNVIDNVVNKSRVFHILRIICKRVKYAEICPALEQTLTLS